jgi:hypothetical protein
MLCRGRKNVIPILTGENPPSHEQPQVKSHAPSLLLRHCASRLVPIYSLSLRLREARAGDHAKAKYLD